MARPHVNLQPWEPTESDPFDRVKAAHLLNRAGFGGTPEEIDHVLSVGPIKAVDELLDFPDEPAEKQTPDDIPDFSAIEDYPRNTRELRQLFGLRTPEERMELRQMLQRANAQALQATGHWWLRRMVNGPHPLQEKLAFFWHGHFTTSAKDERSTWLIWQQNELLRAQAAGNFRNFVQRISRDPAMLDYLNNSQNRKASPNENYARELMELFTLGIGNYTENDIKEAARAFTGWAHDGEEYVFRPWDHDEGQKTIFGLRGNFNGDDVIDILIRHRACAPYVASRIFRYFVHETPDEKLVASLGQQFRDMKFEIRPLMRMILTCREFYAPNSIGVQIKSPVQLVVGTLRALDLDVPQGRVLTGALTQMGQVPFFPPTVKGWPTGRQWINTSTLFARYNTAMFLAGAASSSNVPVGPGGRVRRQQALANRRRQRLGPGFESQAAGLSPSEAVDYWLGRLIQRPIAEDKRQVLLDAIGRAPVSEAAERKLVQLIVSMPEYQLC